MTYIDADGTAHPVQLANYDSVMRGALNNAINGIVGECGGALACATCHCYVDAAWLDRVGPPFPDEADMLKITAVPARPNSRLACQIFMDDTLDGLIVHLPTTQF